MTTQAQVPWLAVSRPRDPSDHGDGGPVRVLLPVVVAALAVLVLVSVVGSYAARHLAEREAVNDAANTTDLLARAVAQPALTDGILTGDPAAAAKLSAALHDYMPASSVIRVKLWSRDGEVVWSDEPRLIGAVFPLGGEEREVLQHPATRADVSDLDEPENRYERGNGRLLEVYRPVRTPDGTPLLFETYSRYDTVTARSGQLWRGFAGVTISSLLFFAVLLTPLLWRLLGRLRRAQRQREALLEKAVDASQEERRRIAGTLHDGPVQELAATSYAVSGAAARLAATGDTATATELDHAAGTLRSSIGSLRSLLVDLHPPGLETAGLRSALGDLAAGLRPRGIHVDVDVDDELALTTEQERLVYRVARECLHNVRRHAAATRVALSLRQTAEGVVLEVADDGVGFDPAQVLADPPHGHLGLRVLADVASDAGADLAVASAPGLGCVWRLRLP
ncbi:sensor histidine kinase [Nocardioides sp. CER19]|uniref:sensor histidine kinase n=1 Tax=Nocardioides sp. CER19 TaxID=3038538 RepID=UPI0024482309|nr:sensor histidine kinase [Nocardioides sp. CER19]MDH2416864.1 sensor histidine kinase [Nocardioides sp. CER19]